MGSFIVVCQFYCLHCYRDKVGKHDMDESCSRKRIIIVLILIRSSYATKSALDWNETGHWDEICVEGTDLLTLKSKTNSSSSE
jgi:hypothetical protein